jgi:flavodoxin I
MCGYTSTEGYLHDASKSIRGDKFCGLLLDAVNQEELTEERVQNWVSALRAEGILEGGGAGSSSVPVVEPEMTMAEVDTVVVSDASNGAEQPDKATSGYAAHYNPRTDKTMWVNADGRSSFVTAGKP